jgi:gentisate 1,2-dioxygenase
MTEKVKQDSIFSEYYKDLEQHEVGALWKDLGYMVTREPVHDVEPYLWKWETIKNYCLKAGSLPLGPDAERRVVYLQNPSLKKKGLIGYGTNTLYAGIQMLLPGEVAPAHRHTQTAIRFIIEGDGAFTAVNGQKTYMERGDLILTPSGTWHDHGHEGNEPMFWMDGLDVGIVRYFAASFFEGFDDESHPVVGQDNESIRRYSNGAYRPINDKDLDGYPSPLLAYKWESTEQALNNLDEVKEVNSVDGIAVEFINPANGKSADLRVGSMMQRLPIGYEGKAHRHVHSAIYHVLDGSGYTIINGQKFEWSKGDFFILPPWSWHEHVNTGDQPAHLFSINDRPVLKNLNLEREENFKENGGHQVIEATFNPEK